MFSLRNELFWFPVNDCDYENITCEKSYIPVLNWDAENEFTWSLADPYGEWVDASNVTFNTKSSYFPDTIRVDAALNYLAEQIKASKSSLESFTLAPSEDGESIEWSIKYIDDAGEEKEVKTSVNVKEMIEALDQLTLHNVTADEITANKVDATLLNAGETKLNSLIVDTTSEFKWESTFEAQVEHNEAVIMHSTLDVEWDTTVKDMTADNIKSMNIEVSNDLTVWWSASIDNWLTVKWDTVTEKITASWDISTEGNLSVAWTSELTGDVSAKANLTVTGNEEVQWNSTVNGNTTLKWKLNVSGITTLSDNVTAKKDLTVDWHELIRWNLTVNWNETVNGETTFNWKVYAEDDVTAKKNLIVDNKLDVKWLTTLEWAAEVKETLKVTWTWMFASDVTVWENLTVEEQISANTIRADEVVADELRVNEALYLTEWAVAPDFVLQSEKGAPNWVAELDENWRMPVDQLPAIYTTAIVKMWSGVFENSTQCVINDDTITADSYVNISNYTDIVWDVTENIYPGKLVLVSNTVETWAFKYIVVNPLT